MTSEYMVKGSSYGDNRFVIFSAYCYFSVELLHFTLPITIQLYVITASPSEHCTVTAGSDSGVQRRSKL